MASEISNDNADAGPANGPDAHGHAAMLLVESLVHGLIARKIISVADAVEIVEVAVEAKTEIADDAGDSPAHLRRSLGLLTAISSSLRRDVTGH